MKALNSAPCGSNPEGRTTSHPLPLELARHRVLDVKETAKFIGFSVPQTRRLYREKKMPKPLRLSARKLGFRVGELVDWLEARAAE